MLSRNTQELLANTLCEPTANETIVHAQPPRERRPLFVSLDGRKVLPIPYFARYKSNKQVTCT